MLEDAYYHCMLKQNVSIFSTTLERSLRLRGIVTVFLNDKPKSTNILQEIKDVKRTNS